MKKVMLSAFLNLIIFSIILIFSSRNSVAQLGGIKIGLGLSTVQILGNNVATKPFLTRSNGSDVFGASFDGSQPGLRISATFPLDKNDIFDIPIGLDYHFYRGRERQPISSNADIKFRSNIDVATFTLGLNWAFYKFDPSITDAKFYLGIETRTATVFQGTYEREVNYNIAKDTIYSDPTKPTALRFGGAINFGVNGEIFEPWFVNINFGLGIMNLLGRDDSRGELMNIVKKTPTYDETKEHFLFDYHFSLLIQYKL